MLLYGSHTKPDYELEQNKDPPILLDDLPQEQRDQLIEYLQTVLDIKSPSKMMRDSWFGEEPCVAEPNKMIPFPKIVKEEIQKSFGKMTRPEFLGTYLNKSPYAEAQCLKTLNWSEIVENARKMINGKPFETIKPADYDVFFPQPDLPLRIYDRDPVFLGKVVCTNVVESDGSICFTITPASHCDMLDAAVYAFYNGRDNGKTLFIDEISGMESAIRESAANVIERLRDIFSKIKFDKYAQYAVKDPKELKVKLDGSEKLKVEENVIYTNYTQEQIEAAWTSMATKHTDYSKIYNERNPKIMNDSTIKYNEAMDAAKKAYDEAKLVAQREKEQAELAEANEKVASAMKGLYDAYVAQGFTPEQAEKFVTIALEKACCKI